jgi:3-dehydroquinate synthase
MNNYNIVIGNNILINNINNYLDKKYILIIDRNVYNLHQHNNKQIINNALDIFILDAKENNKTSKYVNKLYKMMHKNNISRDDEIIIIGGGLTLDLAGYACATYNRGLKMIYVPTTLLAMVDSSIGSKVAVNKFKTKNLIGTFYNPQQVIIDIAFLLTLSTRLFKSGLVELLKHAFIKDKTILDDLDKAKDIFALKNNQHLLLKIIYKSLLVKKYYVTSDLHDHNLRNILNFGHTFAHALEMSYDDYYHGEAVAIGMIISASLTNQQEEIIRWLEKYDCIKLFKKPDYRIINYDKKRTTNMIKEIVLIKVGQAIIVEYNINDLIDKYKSNYKIL